MKIEYTDTNTSRWALLLAGVFFLFSVIITNSNKNQKCTYTKSETHIEYYLIYVVQRMRMSNPFCWWCTLWANYLKFCYNSVKCLTTANNSRLTNTHTHTHTKIHVILTTDSICWDDFFSRMGDEVFRLRMNNENLKCEGRESADATQNQIYNRFSGLFTFKITMNTATVIPIAKSQILTRQQQRKKKHLSRGWFSIRSAR